MLNTYIYNLIDTALLAVFVSLGVTYLKNKLLDKAEKEGKGWHEWLVIILTVTIVTLLTHFAKTNVLIYAIWAVAMLTSYVGAIMLFIKTMLDRRTLKQEATLANMKADMLTEKVINYKNLITQKNANYEAQENYIRALEESNEKLGREIEKLLQK